MHARLAEILGQITVILEGDYYKRRSYNSAIRSFIQFNSMQLAIVC